MRSDTLVGIIWDFSRYVHTMHKKEWHESRLKYLFHLTIKYLKVINDHFHLDPITIECKFNCAKIIII